MKNFVNRVSCFCCCSSLILTFLWPSGNDNNTIYDISQKKGQNRMLSAEILWVFKCAKKKKNCDCIYEVCRLYFEVWLLKCCKTAALFVLLKWLKIVISAILALLLLQNSTETKFAAMHRWTYLIYWRWSSFKAQYI